MPARQRQEAGIQQIIQPKETLKADVQNITVMSMRENTIVVIQAIGETELDVHARFPGIVNHRFSRGVIIAQVPVFVIDVHLDIERVDDMIIAVSMATGIENDLGMIPTTEWDARTAAKR